MVFKPGRELLYRVREANLPSDSIILTHLPVANSASMIYSLEIGGLQRIMDMGQCNDAYGAIQVAVALAGAFNCGVSELPLSFDFPGMSKRQSISC